MRSPSRRSRRSSRSRWSIKSFGDQPPILRAHRPRWLSMNRAGLERRESGGDVRQDDDRELEAFRLVHRHQAHAVASLFENRRLRQPRRLDASRAASRRNRGTTCRRQPRTGAPARRRAARWRAPVRRLAAARSPTCARVRIEQRPMVSATGLGSGARADRQAAAGHRRTGVRAIRQRLGGMRNG